MDHPARRISNEVGQSIRTVMSLLHEAYEYSHNVERSVWDFAVEVELLRMAGASYSDLRWLVCKDYVQQADEIAVESGEGRRFRQNGHLALSSATCFVATELGIHFAEQMGSARTKIVSLGHQPTTEPSQPTGSGDLLGPEPS